MAMLPRKDPRAWPRVFAGLALGVAFGAAAGFLIASRWTTPDTASAEAGFARDMATHHAQAVEMAFAVRDVSSDAAIRALAYDIAATQSTQRGVFMGWLQAWGLPQSSTGPRMAWMPGHAHQPAGANGQPLMHGMASDEEMRTLHGSAGRDAEVLFLQLMIRHHEGGVIMARAVVPLTRRADVLAMARSIDEGQRVEIAAMTQMLAARDARPFESLLE